MKRLILYSLTTLLFFSTFLSCSVLKLVNLEEKTKYLELGMTRQEVVATLGNNFLVESATRMPEGTLEILHFYSGYNSADSKDYLLYFLNGALTEYHTYIVPPVKEHPSPHNKN